VHIFEKNYFAVNLKTDLNVDFDFRFNLEEKMYESSLDSFAARLLGVNHSFALKI
jgi:hypothetical protein